jgi:hypothetical protein
VTLFCFAIAPGIQLAVFWLALAGIAEMVHFTLHVTTLQMCAPERLRGRMASLLPVFPAFISIGSLLAGLLASVLSAPVVVTLLVTVALAVVALAWLRSPALRAVTLSALIGGEKK